MPNEALTRVLDSSETARNLVLEAMQGSLNDAETMNRVIKGANSVAANNHNIIGVHALDLRERIFLSEQPGLPAPAVEGEPTDY